MMYDSTEIKQAILAATGAPGYCTARAIIDAEIALLLNVKSRANAVLAQIDEAKEIAKEGGDSVESRS